MEATLVLITLISIAAAVTLSVMGWSLLRNDRRRSDARVAALGSMAFQENDEPGPENHSGSNFALDDALMSPDTAMFAAAHEPRAPGRRWVAVAAVAIVMAAGAGGAYSVFGPNARIAAAAGPVAPAAVNRAPGSHQLALLSLKHDAGSDGTFVVTGLVKNPADGQLLTRVEALLYLFDDQGNYFAMGRAALEFTTIGPGEESPFVVRVPTTARVGRYRVGFRLEGGGALAHIDKRGQLPSTTSGSGS